MFLWTALYAYCIHRLAETPHCINTEMEAQMRTTMLSLPLAGPLARTRRRLIRAGADRQATRRALDRLDARLLDDIGITAQEARTEAAKPFWQD